MDRVETYVKFKYGIVWKTCQKALPVVGVHLLRWIATYPVDKVIHSLNNWGQEWSQLALGGGPTPSSIPSVHHLEP